MGEGVGAVWAGVGRIDGGGGLRWIETLNSI